MKMESAFARVVFAGVVAAGISVHSRAGAREPGAALNKSLGDSLAVQAVLVDADSTRAIAYVLVENAGWRTLTVPGDWEQYVAESYRLGADGLCATLGEVYCEGDRGTVVLRPRHFFGRKVTVSRPKGALSVAFTVDLGEGLGKIQSNWLDVPAWQGAGTPQAPPPPGGK